MQPPSGGSAAELARGEVLGHGPTEGHEPVALVGVEAAVEVTVDPVGDLDLGGEEVEAAGHPAVALEDEGAIVEPALAAEALGEAARPRPLLTGGLVAWEGHDGLQAGEGKEAPGRQEPRGEEPVLG